MIRIRIRWRIVTLQADYAVGQKAICPAIVGNACLLNSGISEYGFSFGISAVLQSPEFPIVADVFHVQPKGFQLTCVGAIHENTARKPELRQVLPALWLYYYCSLYNSPAVREHRHRTRFYTDFFEIFDRSHP